MSAAAAAAASDFASYMFRGCKLSPGGCRVGADAVVLLTGDQS